MKVAVLSMSGMEYEFSTVTDYRYSEDGRILHIFWDESKVTDFPVVNIQKVEIATS